MEILKPEEVTTFPKIRQLSPEVLAEVYRLGRAEFTAEDLQKYSEVDEGIPVEDILHELEEQQKQFDQKNP